MSADDSRTRDAMTSDDDEHSIGNGLVARDQTGSQIDQRSCAPAMPREGETIDMWRCEKCGEMLPSPAREHRHAEGGWGVYYPVVRLRLRVEQIADVIYEGGEWVHTPRPSPAPTLAERATQIPPSPYR